MCAFFSEVKSILMDWSTV